MANDAAPSSRRVRRLTPALVAALAVAVAGYVARDAILGTPVATVTATRGDLAQTVVASGRVITPQRVAIGATLTERVARIPVEEGQRVGRGAVLIVLDDSNERAEVAQRSAAVAQAEAKLRQLREVALPAARHALAEAHANAVQARLDYERARALRAKGFVGQAQLDDARRARDVAESQLRAARLRVETNRPSGSDYALAQTALAQANASLAAAQARLDQTVIRAPSAGVLIARNIEPGDVVQPGKELMALAPDGETQIEVQIDEKNLGLVALGQPALVSADAYPKRRFAATLVYINPGIDPLRGSVEVKLKVPRPPAYLRQDMTVSVDIEVARRSGVITVPSEAVHDVYGGHPWVLVVQGHRALRRAVELGLRGEGRIEVRAGVQPHDRLVVPGESTVKPGERVRLVESATPERQ